ncbi:MAG: hypothetical protein FJ255_10220 [Phycisphaerae bacterium]|nr:hypothetical protein [Phycisphaerae bacterium]
MRTALLSVLLSAGIVVAQPCTPAWDGTPGQPGIAGGYAQPLALWNEGAGDRLFVGGSFTSAGGQGIGYLARYDVATGAWSRVGGGINQGSTNAFLTSIVVFRPPQPGAAEELVVGGHFDNAANAPASRALARWNGTRWTNLGAAIVSPNAIWSMLVRHEPGGQRLFVGGQFPAIGGVTGVGVASWDGEAWATHATSITGFSPGVFKILDHDDGSGVKLYASGRYGTLDAAGPLVARWDGASWSNVGAGLSVSSSTTTVNAMAVHDDGTGPALYVGGSPFFINGVGQASVARWNGSAWSPVGQVLTGAVWALVSFNDGSGPALYLGGTAQPGSGYVSKLVGNTWTPLAGGASNSVFGAAALGGDLWVAGNFTTVGGSIGASGLARFRGCGVCPGQGPGACGPADWNEDGTIDFNDLLAFMNDFNAGEPCADVNADGAVDFNDFLAFLNLFIQGC